MKPGTRGALALLAAAMPVIASAAAPVARQASMTLAGQGPYYRLNLPVEIAQTAAASDLADVRVINAAGRMVPHAWLQGDAPHAEYRSDTVPFYAVPSSGKGRAASDDLTLVFTPTTDGAELRLKPATATPDAPTQDWILDTRQIAGSLLQARLGIDAGITGLIPLAIDGSDDLRHWRTVVADAQIVILKGTGETIEQLDVDLRASRARFLRLRWRDAARVPTLTRVTIDSVEQADAPSPVQWTAPIAASRCGEDHCDYPMPGNTPVHSVRVELAEANTLVPVTILGLRPVMQARAEMHSHNPLYLLRHRRSPAPPPTPGERETTIARTVVYRLQQTTGEATSEAIPLDGRVYAGLRVRAEAPISRLGTPAPALRVGSVPRSLVFLAQGEPPFRLQWGVDVPQGKAMPLSVLLPEGQRKAGGIGGTASVDLAQATALGSPTTAPAKKAEPPADQDKKPWLWASLAVGLALLAAMAWSLFRSMDKRS